MQVEILFLETNTTKKLEVSGNKCIVGRSTKADIQIDLECFSRVHFEINSEGDDFFITDLQSTNGVFLNNEKILPGKAIKYSNFYSLEVGGKVAFIISRNECSSKIVKSKTNEVSNVKNDPEIKNKFSKKQIMLPATMVLLIGVGVYFFAKDRRNLNLRQYASNIESRKEARNMLGISLSMLNNISSLGFCNSLLSDLCKEVNLSYPQERLVIEEKLMIIYVNYSMHMKEMGADFLNKISKMKQVEYVLAGFAFNPLILAEAQKNNLENIIVVGIDPVSDLVRAKIAGILDVVKVPQISKDDYKGIFSSLYNGGIHRPFRKYFEDYIYFIDK